MNSANEHTAEAGPDPSAEMAVIRQLTGLEEDRIHLHDDGFMSRGYVIDDGRLVFKFKKSPEVTYEPEARHIGLLNGEDLGIHLQKVVCRAENDEYIGLEGVPGVSLEQCTLTEDQRCCIGRQLGKFLRKLHALRPEGESVWTLDNLIEAWQKRYKKARKTLSLYLSAQELEAADALMVKEMPETLRHLGERNVFSHGDLGDGNILVDPEGRIGVIDFGDAAYMDEASDFMDLTDDRLCGAVLDAYGADETLRRKVEVQRRIRPLFVLDVYAGRDEKTVRKLIRKIRGSIFRAAEAAGTSSGNGSATAPARRGIPEE